MAIKWPKTQASRIFETSFHATVKMCFQICQYFMKICMLPFTVTIAIKNNVSFLPQCLPIQKIINRIAKNERDNM
jgi:hypothetical protein